MGSVEIANVAKKTALLLALVAAAPAPQHSRYLVVWASESAGSAAMPMSAASDKMAMPGSPAPAGRDFLAVFEVAPRSTDFGRVVTMLPVGSGGHMAHHTNYEMPPDGILFANDFMSGNSFVFDLHDIGKPKLVASFNEAGPFTHAHSFVRLANGNTLATYQYRGPDKDKVAGALVEFDARGHVVRSSDAVDASAEPTIWPYSLAVVPKLDRVVTGSGEMPPATSVSHVLQVWRLSDLKLLKTIVLAKPASITADVAQNAREPRVLADGESVLVSTGNCGLYRMTGLDGTNPSAEFVYHHHSRACGVPTVIGNYWVQADTSGDNIFSLNVSDPAHPVEVGRIALAAGSRPHWVSHEPGGDRIAVTGLGSMSTRVLFARIDRQTGALTLSPQRIDFNRTWPDGWIGPAIPHASIFSSEQQLQPSSALSGRESADVLDHRRRFAAVVKRLHSVELMLGGGPAHQRGILYAHADRLQADVGEKPLAVAASRRTST